ncbi:MAG: DUF86 domain-containing protein [Cellulomonadaceae bacterium]|jgi:uncharacterized protein with HEPN domain|nr:DUF86 domain-containing protein [Cellulomonadaceae bacterium]
MSKERVAEEYGIATVRALEDFLVHADQAQAAIRSKVDVDHYPAELAAEALAVRLGESLNRASRAYVAARRTVGLEQIIATRNVVAHGYDIVDHDLLWRYFSRDLPAAVAVVRQDLEVPNKP